MKWIILWSNSTTTETEKLSDNHSGHSKQPLQWYVINKLFSNLLEPEHSNDKILSDHYLRKI